MAYPPAPNQPQMGYAPVQTSQTNTLAIVSLVSSLVGLLVWGIGPIVGVITGHMALNQIKQNPLQESSRGMAMAGLIIGYILLGLTVLSVVCLIATAGSMFAFLNSIPTATP